MTIEYQQGDNDPLTLSDFDFAFPDELVAHTPLPSREQSRLLIRNNDGSIRHRYVSDLVNELEPGTVLVFNNSKVFPSRLQGFLATGGKVEIFLISQEQSGSWLALGRPMRKLMQGKKIYFEQGLEASIEGRSGDFVTVQFNISSDSFMRWLDLHGFIPLPPYIKRSIPLPAERSPDKERYQTVYAELRGSVAAPTAGLHFSEDLLEKIRLRKIEIQFVSLHVGAGTFLPVKHEILANHPMHEESYYVSRKTVESILKAKASGKKVIAVGTTSLRSLEDLYQRARRDPEKLVNEAGSWQRTDIFLYPKKASEIYKPWFIDGIFTNFHQPKSTLFMLISHLIGLEQAKIMYKEAITQKYRLFSYGDASLLWL